MAGRADERQQALALARSGATGRKSVSSSRGERARVGAARAGGGERQAGAQRAASARASQGSQASAAKFALGSADRQGLLELRPWDRARGRRRR